MQGRQRLWNLPDTKCGKRTICGYEYGRCGAVLAMCDEHDRQIREHIRVCRTMQYGENDVRGDCPNYLRRMEPTI